jgi:class 3 adenylate cyclase
MTVPAPATLTLLFGDIEGSTALLTALGDGWPAVLERERELLTAAVAAAGGRVVDRQGDAIFAAFASARAGVAAALAGQHALAAEAWPAGAAVRVRMALHSGEPTPVGDGYTGLDVVRAARLCEAAHGGQVLLSEATRLLAGVEAADLGTIALRGIEAPARVFQLSAPGLRSDFPALRTAGHSAPLESLSAEERIERAAQDLEARINEEVARSVEGLLRGTDPDPGGG